MADVSKFNLGGEDISVKDATARTSASNALSTAQTAQSTATTAKNTADQALALAQSIEDLSRIEVSYASQTETITITTVTHSE